MKKRFFCLLLAISILIPASIPTVLASDAITVWLNGEKLEFDVSPIIVDGRTLVPFRGILESLGAVVIYEEGYAYGVTPGKMLKIPIGQNYVVLNECSISTEVPAQIVDNRTLVPLRIVSECLGANVSWDANARRIDIFPSDEGYLDWNDNFYYYGDVSDDGQYAHGYGTLYKISDKSVACTGYFENGFLLKGRFNDYVDEDTYYVGSFSDKTFGNREGLGIMYYGDGSVKLAEWSNDIMNGFFAYRYKEESKNYCIYGNAVNGEWHGEITFEFEDGTTETRIYEYGKEVSDNTDNAVSTPIVEEAVPLPPTSRGSSDIPYAFVTANYPLYLYSNDGKTFLGKLTTNEYDRESISCKYGDYGSTYSRTSIFCDYGHYGSDYHTESAFNEYARKPPIIVDSDGDFIAYLTANEYKNDGVTYVKLMRILDIYNQ